MALPLALLLVVLALVPAIQAQASLGRYKVDRGLVHVSGLSSGAYMAVQFGVAHSATVKGIASIAGGPYYCAQDEVSLALSNCMTAPFLINLNPLFAATDSYAASGQIDATANLRTQRNYIFAGLSDYTVFPDCGRKLEDYLLHYQNASQILAVYDVNSGHAQITDNYGNACAQTRAPYINNCAYDSVGDFLGHQFSAALKPRVAHVAANLIKFNQAQYPGASMQAAAYVYVPTACQQGAVCALHVAFHGCQQNSENAFVGEQYVRYGGYNEWAEANNIIALYPQAAPTPGDNPNACWDWWGYADSGYATKNGSQVRAVKAMMDQLMSG